MISTSLGKSAFNYVAKDIVLRGSVHEVFSQGAKQVLSETSVQIAFRPISLRDLVALVATSILFGTAQILMGDAALYVAMTTLSGISYGVFSVQYGFTASDIASRIYEVIKSRSKP